MNKTEVYSWRMEPGLKGALEQAARTQQTSVARLLDQIVSAWLTSEPGSESDVKVQIRLQEAAASTFGTIRGGDPLRSAQVKQRVRARLKKRRAAQRPD